MKENYISKTSLPDSNKTICTHHLQILKNIKKERHLKSLTFKFMDNNYRLDGIMSTTQDSVNVSFHSAHHAEAWIITCTVKEESIAV